MSPTEAQGIAAENTHGHSADSIKSGGPAKTDDTEQKLRDANNGNEPPSAEDAGNGDDASGGQAGSGDNRPKLPRPKGIQPCPRCGSRETKFCYYNNYNIKQPRYYCRTCQRYWTAGGALRDVPVGAGRRKSKATRSQDDTLSGGGVSTVSLPALGQFLPVAVDRLTPVIPTMLPPGIIPTVAFPTAEMPLYPTIVGDSLTKVTANGLLPDPAAYLMPNHLMNPALNTNITTKTGATVSQQPTGKSEPSDDGAVDGRRTKRKTEKGEDGGAPVGAVPVPVGAMAGPPVRPMSSGGPPVPLPGVMPMAMPPYAMDWFAAQQHPHAAAAMQGMQAQFAAAAGYSAPPFGMPGVWPYGYGGFPAAAAAGWPPAAYSARYPGQYNFPGEAGVPQPRPQNGAMPSTGEAPAGHVKPDHQEGAMVGHPPGQPHVAAGHMPPPQVMPWGGAAQWPPMAMTMPMSMPYGMPAGHMPAGMPVPGPPIQQPNVVAPAGETVTIDGNTTTATAPHGTSGNRTSI